MATDYFGAAVYPIEPYLLYSTDDTTEYILEGTMKQFVLYVLTTKTSMAKRSTNAVCKWEDNKSLSGMHVVHLLCNGHMYATCLYHYWSNRERDANQQRVYSR